ncbi:hypothetical protein AXG93_496s1050 [Marchantia polymorpha subsp. ruderalis]|uniref:hAT-like transposase RNase-H fold domain-containing protein n=1 Tax=Marchantia polymorpha subsp. ruderalis TaxID=1480154 RepID=A0A176VPI3_MARPO|nr:hypothetical protein AXG93_496s1050 [Marchantia polymorpha subsp. ruderalis]
MHSADGIPSLYGWLPCCDHIISTILTTIIDKRTRMIEGKKSAPFYEFYHLALELFDTIDQVKALVTYVKQANLQDEIAKTLKQENVTRWNSALRCMISVDEALPELTKILRARGRRLVSKVTKIDHELLKEFIAFLVPFQEAILALEMFEEPTLHRVLYFWQNLLKHCQVVEADITIKEKDGTITTLKKYSPAFIALKPKFVELIREKFIWSDIHVIATLLNPKTKCHIDKFGIDSADIELSQKNLENMMKDHMIGSGIGKGSVRYHKKQKKNNQHVLPSTILKATASSKKRLLPRHTMSKKCNQLHPSKLDDLMFLRSMLMSSTVQIKVPPITES